MSQGDIFGEMALLGLTSDGLRMRTATVCLQYQIPNPYCADSSCSFFIWCFRASAAFNLSR